MTPESFEYIRLLLRQQAAIVLDDGKVYLVEARLGPLAYDEGLSGIDELVERLHRNPSGPLVARMVDAMTTNETYFFRDRSPFELLKARLLPHLMERSGGHARINVWSAGCSSGQEPYSLVMTLIESCPAEALGRFRVLATDVSDTMLQRGRAGTYSQLEVERGLSDDYRHRYFRQVGEQWQIRDDIRQAVTFRHMNLISDWPQMPTMDLVFLRNVMVYFDVSTRRRILDKIHSLLSPHGCLILGGSETTFGIDNRFERILTDYCSYYQLA